MSMLVLDLVNNYGIDMYPLLQTISPCIASKASIEPHEFCHIAYFFNTNNELLLIMIVI